MEESCTSNNFVEGEGKIWQDHNSFMLIENGEVTTRQKYEKKNCCHKYCSKINKENLLVILTVVGVVIGVLVGCSVRLLEPSKEAIYLISFPGELFMRMLKLLIIPILFTSVVVGLAKLDYRKCGRMWVHCFTYYITTTLLAVLLGIALVSAIKPGYIRKGEIEFEKKEQKHVTTLDSFLDLLRNLIPDNIITACFQVVQTRFTEIRKEMKSLENVTSAYNHDTNATLKTIQYEKHVVKVDNTNALGIIAFAMFFGVTLSRLSKEGKIVTDFVEALNAIFMKMIMIILWISPIGIGSLIAGNLLKMSSILDVLHVLGLYVGTVVIGLFIHCVVTIPVIYFAVTRKNPFKVYYGVLQAFLTAVGTASSAGTLPITMNCLENNVGVDKRVTEFVLPLGATMNMDGTALLEGVAAIAIAQMNDISLSAGQIVTISLTTTLTSIGAAAIPSAGLVALLIVLNAIGVPADAVGLLWSIDWFLDRIRTGINVLGDCIGAAIVEHLNVDVLRSEENNKEVTSSNKFSNGGKELEPIFDSGVSVA